VALITHMNYKNEEGNVYCCLRNKVVSLNKVQTLHFCSTCTMFKGLNSTKVNCSWEDIRDLENPHCVIDPYLEYKSMQQRKITRPIIIEAEVGGYR
jgi:hypothetical protein